jgi:hypothetical protein
MPYPGSRSINRVVPLGTAVTGIAFNGIHDTVLDSLDDASVIRKSVLRTGIALLSQSKKIIMPASAL